MTKTEEKIRNIISAILEVDVDVIHEDTAIGDLPSWDSLNHLKIIGRIEKEFDIRFTPDVMMDLEDVSDIVNATEARVK